MSNIGGGIVVSTMTGSSQADLPWLSSWRVTTVRSTAEATTLAGTVIRQSSSKSVTTGTASYSGMVDSAQANALKTIDSTSTSVVLSDGFAVYEAIMDANVSDTIRGGKKAVEASFQIVRQIF